MALRRIEIILNHVAGQNRPATKDIADNDVFIVSVARTPIGSFNGSLSSVSAPRLGGLAIQAALKRLPTTIQPSLVEHVILGNVLSAGVGQAPARQASLHAGLPTSVCCTTVNKVCASGLKAVHMAASSIRLNEADIVVAGGMENMSQVPYYVPQARNGLRLGNGTLVDGMQFDGLWDPHYQGAMGVAGEKWAKQLKITRQAQDEYAKESYARSRAAVEKKVSTWEISPVTVKKQGKEVRVEKDEEVSKLDVAKLGQLKPVFAKDGTITAANASKLSDGAAACVLMSGRAVKKYGVPVLARVVAYADAEVAPQDFPVSPAAAIPLALKRAGLQLNDIDFFEINEAFSAVALANAQMLNIPAQKLNVFGGAVSLGHPLGASGARILVTLINVLRSHSARYGVAAICNGGGGGSAIVIERITQ